MAAERKWKGCIDGCCTINVEEEKRREEAKCELVIRVIERLSCFNLQLIFKSINSSIDVVEYWITTPVEILGHGPDNFFLLCLV